MQEIKAVAMVFVLGVVLGMWVQHIFERYILPEIKRIEELRNENKCKCCGK